MSTDQRPEPSPRTSTAWKHKTHTRSSTPKTHELGWIQGGVAMLILCLLVYAFFGRHNEKAAEKSTDTKSDAIEATRRTTHQS